MNAVFLVGKKHFGEDKNALRDKYFKMLYQVLIGQDSGPRFSNFIVAYGVPEMLDLLQEKLR